MGVFGFLEKRDARLQDEPLGIPQRLPAPMGHRAQLPHCIRPFASGQTVSQFLHGVHQQPRAHQNLRVEDRGVEGVGV